MSFSYRYLGFLTAGSVITVQVNQQAHVALLDTINLNRYTHKQAYRHYGELQSRFEDKYTIPYPGEWHIVVYSNSPLNQLNMAINFRKKTLG